MLFLKNIKPKKGIWNVNPLLSKHTAHAIYPKVYLPQKIYLNLKSKKPSKPYVALLLHEQMHIRRQKEIGWFLWYLKYLLFHKFRYEEEIKATIEEMKYLKRNKRYFDTSRRARHFSSYLYLWCCSYNEAKRNLEILWGDI